MSNDTCICAASPSIGLALLLVAYECNRQKNLKTLRGAKSNGLFLGGTKWNRNCPYDGLGAMRS